MIISLRQLSRFLRMIVFVALFSFICFKVLLIVQHMIQPTTNKYKEPVGGDALRVSAELPATSLPESVGDQMMARLAQFYQLGE